jgi:CHAD domain-containing protein
MPSPTSTRTRRRFHEAFARRLEAFRHSLPLALAGDIEAVHDARVASRRLREAMPVLQSAADTSGLPKLGRRMRQVTRALGSVRDLDVSLELLDEVGTIHSSLQPILAGITKAVSDERRARHDEMLKVLEKVDPDRLAGRVDAFVTQFDRGLATSEWRLLLAARLARRAARLMRAIHEAGAMYVAERVHAVRIATKQLRYAIELAGELGGLRTDAAERRLKRMQDVLGRLHDLEVLKERARVHGAHPASSVADGRDVESLAVVLDGQIRRLHGDYVKRRPTLLGVIEQCRDRFCPPLVAVPVIPTTLPEGGDDTEEHGRGNQPLPGQARHRRGARRRVSGRHQAPAHDEGDRAVPRGGEGPGRS